MIKLSDLSQQPLLDNLDAWATDPTKQGIILADGYVWKVFEKVKGGVKEEEAKEE